MGKLTTEKQTKYLIHLLAANGYDTNAMSAKYKHLGATMMERSGSVEGWLKNKSTADASSLIQELL